MNSYREELFKIMQPLVSRTCKNIHLRGKLIFDKYSLLLNNDDPLD